MLAGRMGYEEQALKLFLCKNVQEAKNITNQLNEYNKQRQDIEKKIYEQAIEQIEKNQLDKNPVIVIAHEGWHHGVIGIVASKITDLYYKPSLLLGIEGNTAKGSGRSVPGFDLHGALCKCSDLLDKFGGHEMAVGVALDVKNINELEEKLQDIAKSSHTEELVSIINIEKEIHLNEITVENIESLNLLEPYGEENRAPLFLCKNLKIDSIRTLSEGKHLKLTLRENKTIIQAIGFNMGDLNTEYLLGDRVDVVCQLEINEFNRNKYLQLNIRDIRKTI